MATNKDIQIRSGRTYEITTEVTGINDWSDKEAVLSIAKNYNESVEQIDGTIDSANNKVSFDLTYSITSNLQGIYDYEVTIYTTDKVFVKDALYGKLNVKPVIDKDPTD